MVTGNSPKRQLLLQEMLGVGVGGGVVEGEFAAQAPSLHDACVVTAQEISFAARWHSAPTALRGCCRAGFLCWEEAVCQSTLRCWKKPVRLRSAKGSHRAVFSMPAPRRIEGSKCSREGGIRAAVLTSLMFPGSEFPSWFF